MAARLLVLQSWPTGPAAWLGEWWEEAGLALDVVRCDLGEDPPEEVACDGLVVLGGGMGAGDDEQYPWLAATRALVAETVERGIPVLGVCLGHQLMAVALGGRVERRPAGRVLGVLPVLLTEAGASDPLLAGSDGLPAVHFNADVVTTLPPGAEVLARLPDGAPQAVRFGGRAWGVQFHPEVPPAAFEDWVRALTVGGLGERELTAMAEVDAAEDALRAAWRPFAHRFAAVVRDAT